MVRMREAWPGQSTNVNCTRSYPLPMWSTGDHRAGSYVKFAHGCDTIQVTQTCDCNTCSCVQEKICISQLLDTHNYNLTYVHDNLTATVAVRLSCKVKFLYYCKCLIIVNCKFFPVHSYHKVRYFCIHIHSQTLHRHNIITMQLKPVHLVNRESPY